MLISCVDKYIHDTTGFVRLIPTTEIDKEAVYKEVEERPLTKSLLEPTVSGTYYDMHCTKICTLFHRKIVL